MDVITGSNCHLANRTNVLNLKQRCVEVKTWSGILHVDQNCFYASVEMQRHPELRDKPLAICGSQEEHHGIVLTANYIAKPYGVKTGMA